MTLKSKTGQKKMKPIYSLEFVNCTQFVQPQTSCSLKPRPLPSMPPLGCGLNLSNNRCVVSISKTKGKSESISHSVSLLLVAIHCIYSRAVPLKGSLHQNHLEGLLKHFTGLHPKILHSVSLEWDCGSAFLTSFQAMLVFLVWKSYLKMAALDKFFTKFKSHMNHIEIL